MVCLLLFMIEILHDVIYKNCRNYGSIVNTGSCRIPIINSGVRHGSESEPGGVRHELRDLG